MSQGKVTGAVKLEEFQATSIRDVEDAATVIVHKLMQSRTQLQFADYISQFLVEACQGLPSQEIAKVIKEIQRVITTRAVPKATDGEEKKSAKKRKVRGTLARDRDDITAAIEAMDYDYDDEEEFDRPAAKKAPAKSAASAAPAATRSLADYQRAVASSTGAKKGKGGVAGGKKAGDDDDWLTADADTIEATKALTKAPAVRLW